MNDDLRAAAQAATPRGLSWEEVVLNEALDDADTAFVLRASPDRILALCDDNKELRAALKHLVETWEDAAEDTIGENVVVLGAPMAAARSLLKEIEARAALEGKP